MSLVSNFPGFMSYDSVEQILEARSGIYSDWHPPIMALLWHFIDKIIPGSFGMLIMDTALIWLGTYMVATHWFKFERYKTAALYPLLIVFFPAVFSITGAIWKDNLMWGCLMLAIGMTGAIKPGFHKQNIAANIYIVGTVCFTFLAILFRHNAVFAAVPLMILCVNRLFDDHTIWRNIMISCCVGITSCSLLVVAATTVNASLVKYKSNPWASVAIFDIAGTIIRMPDHQLQESYFMQIPLSIRGDGSVDRMLQTFSPRFWQTVFLGDHPGLNCRSNHIPTGNNIPLLQDNCFDMTEKDHKDLMRLWLSIIAENPAKWLTHRTIVFRHTIGLDHYGLWDPVFMETNGYPVKVQSIYGLPNPELNQFQVGLKWLITKFSSTWLFRVWIYLSISTYIALRCLISTNRERLHIALIALSGLAHEAGLFFLAPSVDYRYSHYMIYTTLLVTGLYLLSDHRHLTTPRFCVVNEQSIKY